MSDEQHNTVPGPPGIDLPMVCDCGEDGRAAAASLMEEVYRRLSRGTSELTARDVTAENFVSELSRSLWWDFDPGVSIVGIYSDQWFGVKAADDRGENEVSVACDRVEYGLAAIWKYYADHQGVALEDPYSAPQ